MADSEEGIKELRNTIARLEKEVGYWKWLQQKTKDEFMAFEEQSNKMVKQFEYVLLCSKCGGTEFVIKEKRAKNSNILMLKRCCENFKNIIRKDERKNLQNFLAKLIAVAVRNAMEHFHIKHLSDAQMKELNPIIRNAIYSALVNISEDISYVRFYEQYIPTYWEECEILNDEPQSLN